MKKFFSKYFNQAVGFTKGVLTVIILSGLVICGAIAWCAGMVLKTKDDATKEKERDS